MSHYEMPNTESSDLKEDRSREKDKEINNARRSQECKEIIIKKMLSYSDDLIQRITNSDQTISPEKRMVIEIVPSPELFDIQEWNNIKNNIIELADKIIEIKNTPNTKGEYTFDSKGNFSHIFGNGVQNMVALVDKFIKKKFTYEQLEEFKNSLKDSSTEEKRLAKIKKWEEIKMELDDNIKKMIQELRIWWDLLNFYIDFLKDKDNQNILKEEIVSEDGWLKDFHYMYQEGAAIPSHDMERLSHFNFFARLNGWTSKNSILRDNPSNNTITRENFEEEFNKIISKENKPSLNKEEIFKQYFTKETAIAA